MAEVTRRSFDLKSWQGLTEVLKIARESTLAPDAYAQFRNLVLEYAQQKGTDPELKKKIDTIIASFDEPQKTVSEAPVEIVQTPIEKDERSGRRVIPSFPLSKEETPTPSLQVPVIPSVVEPVQVTKIVPEHTPEVVPTVEPASVPEESVKSVEEHRTRVMEIKRHINALIGNPIALMDHGNHIGREYMGALLLALKATSPGATQNVNEAMSSLEEMYQKLITYHETADNEAQIAVTPEPVEMPTEAVAEENISVPEANEMVGDTAPDDVVEIPTARVEEPEFERPAPELTRLEVRSDVSTEPEPVTTVDPDIQSQIDTLRAELKAREEQMPLPKERSKRSLIPSIVEMEEDAIPEEAAVPEKVQVNTDWEPHRPTVDELNTQNLTNRATSTMTGITLGTPQSELASSSITSSLADLLHEWSIFASSGLFGMGPSGIEHPLYIQLSRLPMGEVLSGRFENADMKIVHVIKGYIDAWRHEQGIAYNPTETFEHYLRRVTQRILKRQKGEHDV